MAKIAIAVEQALAHRSLTGAPGNATARVLAQGECWTVDDVICTSGPQDRPFEERHSRVRIAIVAAGSFQYRATTRAAASRELMTLGSLMLGNEGQCFECGHEHGAGDRCLSFGYDPDYFERIAADAGTRGSKADLRVLRLPPLRALSPFVAQACVGLTSSVEWKWEELGVKLAARAVQLTDGIAPRPNGPPGAEARVTRAVRTIERDPNARLDLGGLAREAALSPYHFLRTFERLTGVTPHQYILRTRLREAALRLTAEPTKIVDIALDCGFGDVSNFNRTFCKEFGVSPRGYRSGNARGGSSGDEVHARR